VIRNEDTMDCPMQNGGGADFLMDYAARKLDAAKASLVEDHLAVCPGCAGFVETQRVVWDALEEWDRIEIAPDFDRRLYARIEKEKSPRWMSRKRAGVAGAAVALLAVWLSQSPPRLPSFSREDRVDVEQVERSLEDLEMLRQFNPRT
jgi:hypothetical protein